MPKADVTEDIRPCEDVWAARDADGSWRLYTAKGVDFIKERVGACALVGHCDEEHADRLESYLNAGIISCVPVSTSYGVLGFTKRV